MTTMNVLDSAGSTVAIEKPLAPGRAAAASSRPVALSTEDAAFLDGLETLLTAIAASLAGTLTVGSHAVTNAGTFAVQAAVAATATNIAKAEDVASADADVGVPAMAVRKATPANTSGTDGDYEMLQVSAGRLWTSLRAATSDTIAAKLATDAIMNDTTALTPKFAAIAASSSGNNTLVAAVTSKKIRVLAYNFLGNGAVNAKFQSGASGTDLTGLKYLDGAGAGICAPFNPVGWFETASNTLLNLNLSGAVAVGGELVYVEV